MLQRRVGGASAAKVAAAVLRLLPELLLLLLLLLLVQHAAEQTAALQGGNKQGGKGVQERANKGMEKGPSWLLPCCCCCSYYGAAVGRMPGLVRQVSVRTQQPLARGTTAREAEGGGGLCCRVSKVVAVFVSCV